MTKVEQKFHVKENSQISDIYSKLNSIQKKAIVLFDADRNGTMDAKECKAFNASVFSEQANGDLDIYLQLTSGKKQKTTVKQNEFDNTVLSLERVQNEKTEQRNGKKVRVITPADALKKQKGQSISQKIHSNLYDESTAEWKKVSVDKNGNTKYERKIDCENEIDGTFFVTDYKILDKMGNVIESEINSFIHGSECGDIIGGKIKQKGNKYYHYGENNKFVGTIEIQEDGKQKYSDAKGKVLYYFEEEGKDLPVTMENSSTAPYYLRTCYFYDKNQNLYAVVSEKFFSGGYTNVDEVKFYKNGKLEETKREGYSSPDYIGISEVSVGFEELSKDQLGEFYDSEAPFRK